MVQDGTGLARKQNEPKKGEKADNSDTPEMKASLCLPIYLPGEKNPIVNALVLGKGFLNRHLK